MKTEQINKVVLREDLIAITGDWRKALILNQFLYWTDRVNNVDKLIAQENAIASRCGEDVVELRYGWIYKTAQQMADELLNCASERAISKYMKELVTDNILLSRNNPKYKWDRTLQYKVNIHELALRLEKQGYSIQSLGFKVIKSVDFSHLHEVRINPHEMTHQNVSTCETISDTIIENIIENTCYSHNSHYSSYRVPFPDGNVTNDCSDDVSVGDVYTNTPDGEILNYTENANDITSVTQEIDKKIICDNNEFDYDILHRQLNICIGEMPDKKIAEKYRDEIIDIFDYFYDAYEKVTSTIHPRLSNANIKKVIQMMIDKNNSDDIYIDKLNYEQYICSYFHCRFKGNDIGGCNYSILHFMTVIDDRDRDMETHAYDPETLLRV